MNLPAPNLDDRRFQDIVDEAKRRITRYCPEWTDHNVSDPGVALIELFAWMTEMILYRVNQVPDRLYVKFLELVGIELFSASPARTDLLFTLAAPSPEPVRIAAGTQVGTERGQGEDQIVFMTDEDLHLVQPSLQACLSRSSGRYEDHTDDLRLEGAQVSCFPSLRAGDALYLGFAESLAGNLIELDVTVAGVDAPGIDPRRPPRAWQSWDGGDWRTARILEDTSEGFNSSGRVTLLLASRHEPLAIGAMRAHWLRCKLVDVVPGQPPYHISPMLDTVIATGLGGAVAAHHAEPAPAELLGVSDGRPGQTFQVRRIPVLARRPGETVRVDAEAVENAKVRGPLYRRGGPRAVTATDFERLPREAAPGVARARCLPPTGPGEPVRLLIVPRVEIEPERLVLEDLALPEPLEQRIKGFLDERRLLTTRVLLDVPSYQGITVTAEVHAAPTVRAEKVRTEAESALYRFINPITGGPDGRGWPFDLDLSLGDVLSALPAVPGRPRPGN